MRRFTLSVGSCLALACAGDLDSHPGTGSDTHVDAEAETEVEPAGFALLEDDDHRHAMTPRAEAVPLPSPGPTWRGGVADSDLGGAVATLDGSWRLLRVNVARSLAALASASNGSARPVADAVVAGWVDALGAIEFCGQWLPLSTTTAACEYEDAVRVAPLAALPQLTTLQLMAVSVLDPAALRTLTNVHTLELRPASVDGGSGSPAAPPIAELAAMPSLRNLIVYAGYEEAQVPVARTLDVSTLVQLVSLELGDVPANHDAPLVVKGLERLTSLETLALASLKLSTNTIPIHDQLTELSLEDVAGLDGAAFAVANPSLTALRLGNVNDRGLRQIARGCPSLQTLELPWSDVTDLRPVRSLKALRHLDASGEHIHSLAPLAGMALDSLDVSGQPIRSFTPVATLRLHSFIAASTTFGDLGLLARSKDTLAVLDLSMTPFTPEEGEADLAPLLQFKALKSLRLVDAALVGCEYPEDEWGEGSTPVLTPACRVIQELGPTRGVDVTLEEMGC